MAIKYIDQLEMKGKRAIIRVDYNVPYDKEMNITDDTRIKATLPTLKYCLEHGAAVIIISHLGRPKGKVVPKLSLKPVAECLSKLLLKEVIFIDRPISSDSDDAIPEIKPGEIALLENIRFYPGEEINDNSFGKLLATLGDVYINDAFAAAHRGHASNEAITRHVRECAAGFLLKDEIEYFNKAFLQPERPFITVIGGAKISTKLDALKNIINNVNSLIIGGAMAFTFMKARGYSVGKSLVEDDLIDNAKEILNEADRKKVEVLLPVDLIAASEMDENSESIVCKVEDLPDDMMGLDIGPETVNLFSDVIRNSKTVVWNGPMGAFEIPSFSNGTDEIARIIAETPCLSIIGGGDTVSAIHKSGLADKFSYMSTGGGAFLELLEGKTLPAIAALDR